MLIGILETGRPPSELVAAHGNYPLAFEHLLRDVGPAWRYEHFAALEDELPEQANVCDAWIVTGSRFGAYDTDPWITRLETFLRDAYQAAVPIVGICFGHQLLAQALGGRVIKSEKGWGIGMHRYDLLQDAAPDWLRDGNDTFQIHAFHQDQVVEVPPDGQVVASSEFCPVAALTYGDRAFTLQGHPEFDSAFLSDLVTARRAAILEDATAEAALASTKARPEQQRAARWIAGFLQSALQNRTLQNRALPDRALSDKGGG
ncbi:MAG: GMP synthase [Gammaproteobacteria bacterium]|nr:GMP synthase [Gammaproteobacteria bacterium]